MAGASTSGAPPKRLSTAAQFFEDEDQTGDAEEVTKKSTNEKVRKDSGDRTRFIIPTPVKHAYKVNQMYSKLTSI